MDTDIGLELQHKREPISPGRIISVVATIIQVRITTATSATKAARQRLRHLPRLVTLIRTSKFHIQHRRAIGPRPRRARTIPTQTTKPTEPDITSTTTNTTALRPPAAIPDSLDPPYPGPSPSPIPVRMHIHMHTLVLTPTMHQLREGICATSNFNANARSAVGRCRITCTELVTASGVKAGPMVMGMASA
ncbi:hypothetical protein PHISP_07628 [Aspergillus sp. HF37]|nr:hypothetical protein PHISP_07628 [Aspergillus sp. HF37]